MRRAFVTFTSAAGSLNAPGRSADARFANVASHSGHAPCPSHDRPCHDVRRLNDAPWRRFRDVRLPCCARLLPSAGSLGLSAPSRHQTAEAVIVPHLPQFPPTALHFDERYGFSGDFSSTGSVMEKTVPCGWFGVAQSRPPCASTIERQIDSPMPRPLALVV